MIFEPTGACAIRAGASIGPCRLGWATVPEEQIAWIIRMVVRPPYVFARRRRVFAVCLELSEVAWRGHAVLTPAVKRFSASARSYLEPG